MTRCPNSQNDALSAGDADIGDKYHVPRSPGDPVVLTFDPVGQSEVFEVSIVGAPPLPVNVPPDLLFKIKLTNVTLAGEASVDIDVDIFDASGVVLDSIVSALIPETSGAHVFISEKPIIFYHSPDETLSSGAREFFEDQGYDLIDGLGGAKAKGAGAKTRVPTVQLKVILEVDVMSKEVGGNQTLTDFRVIRSSADFEEMRKIMAEAGIELELLAAGDNTNQNTGYVSSVNDKQRTDLARSPAPQTTGTFDKRGDDNHALLYGISTVGVNVIIKLDGPLDPAGPDTIHIKFAGEAFQDLTESTVTQNLFSTGTGANLISVTITNAPAVFEGDKMETIRAKVSWQAHGISGTVGRSFDETTNTSLEFEYLEGEQGVGGRPPFAAWVYMKNVNLGGVPGPTAGQHKNLRLFIALHELGHVLAGPGHYSSPPGDLAKNIMGQAPSFTNLGSGALQSRYSPGFLRALYNTKRNKVALDRFKKVDAQTQQ